MDTGINLDPDFREFIQLLNAHDVHYLVVGGFAVAFHRHPRNTKDIDIWVWLDAANAEKSTGEFEAQQTHFWASARLSGPGIF